MQIVVKDPPVEPDYYVKFGALSFKGRFVLLTRLKLLAYSNNPSNTFSSVKHM